VVSHVLHVIIRSSHGSSFVRYKKIFLVRTMTFIDGLILMWTCHNLLGKMKFDIFGYGRFLN
jgi:hypothetical protein